MGIIKDDFLKEEKAKAEAKQKSKYEEALSKYNTDIDDKAVQEAVRKIKRFMEDEENLSKSSQKILKSLQEKRKGKEDCA